MFFFLMGPLAKVGNHAKMHSLASFQVPSSPMGGVTTLCVSITVEKKVSPVAPMAPMDKPFGGRIVDHVPSHFHPLQRL